MIIKILSILFLIGSLMPLNDVLSDDKVEYHVINGFDGYYVYTIDNHEYIAITANTMGGVGIGVVHKEDCIHESHSS